MRMVDPCFFFRSSLHSLAVQYCVRCIVLVFLLHEPAVFLFFSSPRKGLVALCSVLSHCSGILLASFSSSFKPRSSCLAWQTLGQDVSFSL